MSDLILFAVRLSLVWIAAKLATRYGLSQFYKAAKMQSAKTVLLYAIALWLICYTCFLIPNTAAFPTALEVMLTFAGLVWFFGLTWTKSVQPAEPYIRSDQPYYQIEEYIETKPPWQVLIVMTVIEVLIWTLWFFTATPV